MRKIFNVAELECEKLEKIEDMFDKIKELKDAGKIDPPSFIFLQSEVFSAMPYDTVNKFKEANEKVVDYSGSILKDINTITSVMLDNKYDPTFASKLGSFVSSLNLSDIVRKDTALMNIQRRTTRIEKEKDIYKLVSTMIEEDNILSNYNDELSYALKGGVVTTGLIDSIADDMLQFARAKYISRDNTYRKYKMTESLLAIFKEVVYIYLERGIYLPFVLGEELLEIIAKNIVIK